VSFSRYTARMMKLIGQFDSPFVRRVGIAMHLYGVPYEHVPWSVWADADRLALHNPLRRVPTLLLADGTALVESFAILELLDEQAGPERALLPRSGLVRREGLRICALATGLADKAVSLFYEQLLRDAPSQVWMARCRDQIADTLDALERERSARSTTHWFGDALTHADITVGCVLRFVSEAHPGLFDARRWPRLAAHSAQCEALEPFRAIQQPFVVTMSNA
jgi:glutathione S-transferase